MGVTRKPLWFGDEPRRHDPSNYVSEGTPATPCPTCGELRQWMYIGKRRRPRVMCPRCDEMSGRSFAAP